MIFLKKNNKLYTVYLVSVCDSFRICQYILQVGDVHKNRGVPCVREGPIYIRI